MPIVQIHLMEGRDKAKKSALVKQVTDAVCNSLGVQPKNVRIILSEMAKEDFAISGQLVADQDDPFGNKVSG